MVCGTGNKQPAHRISARGALSRPFSVSEKCGTHRQAQVSTKNSFNFVQTARYDIKLSV